MANNIRFNYEINEQEIAKTLALTKKLNKENNLAQKELTQLKAKYAGVNSQLAITNRRLAGMSGQLKATSTAASGLRTALIGTFSAAGAVLAIGTITRLLAKFGKEMSRVKALTSATTEEFKKLNELAITLGKNTIFTATQAAEGMAFLAQAGFTTKEIFASMKDTLDLAAAAQIDLGSAADIVTNIMRGFGLEADELTEAVNVLSAQFTSSNTDLLQLGEAMKFVAPVAKGFGQDIASTSAALGFLADAGLQASIGGTGLRKILTTLAISTKKLGIETFDTATKQMKPLADIIELLEERTFSAGEEYLIFGQRGGPALQVLLERGSEALREQTREINNAKSAAFLAIEQMDNLAGDLNQLAAGAESAALEQGFLNTALRFLIQLGKQSIRPLTTMFSIQSQIERRTKESAESQERYNILLEEWRRIAKEVTVEEAPELTGAFFDLGLKAEKSGVSVKGLKDELSGLKIAFEEALTDDEREVFAENIKKVTAEINKLREPLKLIPEDIARTIESIAELSKKGIGIEGGVDPIDVLETEIAARENLVELKKDEVSLGQELLLVTIESVAASLAAGESAANAIRRVIKGLFSELISRAILAAFTPPTPFSFVLAGSFAGLATGLFDKFVPKFHEGGYTGDGSGEFDAKLKRREFVIKESAISHYGLPMIEDINNMDFSPVVLGPDMTPIAKAIENQPRNFISVDENGWMLRQQKGNAMAIKKAKRFSMNG